MLLCVMPHANSSTIGASRASLQRGISQSSQDQHCISSSHLSRMAGHMKTFHSQQSGVQRCHLLCSHGNIKPHHKSMCHKVHHHQLSSLQHRFQRIRLTCLLSMTSFRQSLARITRCTMATLGWVNCAGRVASHCRSCKHTQNSKINRVPARYVTSMSWEGAPTKHAPASIQRNMSLVQHSVRICANS